MGSSVDGFTAARASDGSCCVEVRRGATVAVRDSKYAGDPDRQPVLLVPAEEWTAFLSSPTPIDRFDGDHLVVEPGPDGHAIFRSTDGQVELVFTPGEIAAFLDGVANHEFDVVTGAS